MKPVFPFTCNICETSCTFQEEHYSNAEAPSCTTCGSNVRFRWLVFRLSQELFGRSLPLTQFPVDISIKGIGLTDPASIAQVLADRFNYRNTFFDAEPRLNIKSDPSPLGALDFLIASEVFEHVEPPVSDAFRNAASFLKNTGVLLLTVPWVWGGAPENAIPNLYDWKLGREDNRWLVLNRRPDGQIERFYDMVWDNSPGPGLGYTREHFPELNDWKLENENESWRLVNKRRDGTVETFHNLVFHGGSGLTLEMRLFTNRGLEDELRKVGFTTVEFEMQDHPEIGIIFPDPWTRPLVARRQ